MIEVTPTVKIDESEIQYEFIRASAPGGQNVNKVSTAVQLRFDALGSPSLPAEVKERLKAIAGKRLTEAGVLIIDARRYRTQEQNRADALLRLMALLREAVRKPKPRRPTRPTVTARARRASAKRAHSEKKRWRRYIPEEWEE
jgi:ribosome-associated protein